MKICIISFPILDGIAFDIDGRSITEKFFKIEFIKPQTSETIDKFVEKILNLSTKSLSFEFIELEKIPREESVFEFGVKGSVELSSGKIEFIFRFVPENAEKFEIK